MINKNIEPSVLLVDDDEDIRYALSRILKSCNCKVNEAESVEDALGELSQNHYDVVFSDMRFNSAMGGEELLEEATKQYKSTNIVLISSTMDARRSADLRSKGAAVCLEKPFFKDKCLEVLSEIALSDIKAA